MYRHEIILETKTIKYHKGKPTAYFYFRYDSVPKCIILDRQSAGGFIFTKATEEKARELVYNWYQRLEEEDDG